MKRILPLLLLLCLNAGCATTLVARECYYLSGNPSHQQNEEAVDCMERNWLPMPDIVRKWFIEHCHDPLAEMFLGWHY